MKIDQGKIIIGLTGNIGSGKSVVRKMLVRLGALGIDADKITHSILLKDGPGFIPVVSFFGHQIIGENGEIDRKKLGDIVFANKDNLQSLESIIHPFVRKAVDYLIQKSSQQVIVVEAIKLLESPLKNTCDQIWVTSIDEHTQMERLIKKRKMDSIEVKNRISSQSSQAEKISQADIVIGNSGGIDKTWEMVKIAWDSTIVPLLDVSILSTIDSPSIDAFEITNATPKDASSMAEFINSIEGGKLSRLDVLTMFGERAFMIIAQNNNLIGILGWQVENMISRSDKLWFNSERDLNTVIELLIEKVEKDSISLQAEVSLIFIQESISLEINNWANMGYQHCLPADLPVKTWQEAALEHLEANHLLFYKQIRSNRVLKPI